MAEDGLNDGMNVVVMTAMDHRTSGTTSERNTRRNEGSQGAAIIGKTANLWLIQFAF